MLESTSSRFNPIQTLANNKKRDNKGKENQFENNIDIRYGNNYPYQSQQQYKNIRRKSRIKMSTFKKKTQNNSDLLSDALFKTSSPTSAIVKTTN